MTFCWVHIDRKGLRDGVLKIREFVRAYSSCSSCTATQRGRCSIGESYGSDRLFGAMLAFQSSKPQDSDRLNAQLLIMTGFRFGCKQVAFAVATAFVAGTGDCKDDF